jgi:hypothetical protein
VRGALQGRVVVVVVVVMVVMEERFSRVC